MSPVNRIYFLIGLRDKLSEMYPISFEWEIKKLNELISDYSNEKAKDDEARESILESLSECL